MEEFTKRPVKIEQKFLDLLNQVFEIEKKVINLKEDNSIIRNINKLKILFEEQYFTTDEKSQGLIYHNPINEHYNETRTDCEASISGMSPDNLVIVDVIKPIIYYSYIENGTTYKTIVQKGIVVAETK